ncbi:DUF2240 family protein [Methanoplanus sp. FWC-SCC4]|uniref:DUF2240 family protein n=1 Tax=Methanochimaera problematica TaxID=2609417 RepID=A0AA97FAF5_9EURY|nr:DUF2240 family protein [Methanoplanus sp. FWC-SCC4]WOF15532.1 DUF2240 family protein [Methanoplanus sp. FWC-SCC4]
MTLKTVIAAPFKNMRKQQLKKGEFIYFLTIDKRWMNKDQVVKLINMGVDSGLISENDGYLSPGFDVSGTDIPLGYKPSSSIFENNDPVERLLEDIAGSLNTDVSKIVSEMNMIIKDVFDGNLRPEAACVILARKYDVDFEGYLEDLEKNIEKE